MRVVFATARLLLGFIFVVFGLNGFLNFIPMAPVSGMATQFMGAFVGSHYSVVIFVIQVVGGALLLIGRYVPLALTILGPVIVNILCFHTFMDPRGIPPALLVTVLWFVVYIQNRAAFTGLFQARAGEPASRHAQAL